MITLIYGSTATNSMSEDELLEILEKSHKNNLKVNVTGMLLYYDNNFLQVLEGEEADVMSVFNRIQQDPRHQGIMVYVKQPVTKRQFGEWEMGFVNVKNLDAKKIKGFSNFLNDPDHNIKLEEISYAHAFLNIFRENIR